MKSKLAFVKPVPKLSGLPFEIQRENPLAYSPGFKYGSTSVIKGITFEEQNQLLPNIIGISSNSPEFQSKVDEFYQEYTYPVPFDGVYIEMGVQENGQPINSKEYIFGKLLEEDNNVAKKQQDVDNPHFFKYVLTYKEEEDKKEIQKYAKQKQADIEFVKLIADEANINKIKFLVVINKDYFKETVLSLSNLNTLQLEERLKRFVNSNPEEFIKQVKNEDLQYLAFVHSALDINMFVQSGESIFYENEQIGINISNTADVLKKDSAMYNKLFADYKVKRNVNTY